MIESFKQPDLLAILLAEDNEADAILIKLYAQSFANIKWVKSLSEAVISIKNSAPDVILLDLSLPDSSDTHAVAEIRKLTALPLLVVTGSNNMELYERCALEGADSVIFKDNLNSQELFRRIQVAISRRKYLSNYIMSRMEDHIDEINSCKPATSIETTKHCRMVDNAKSFSDATENLIQKIIKLNATLTYLNNKDTIHGTIRQ
jgi:CheY-like chemotaxis protein